MTAPAPTLASQQSSDESADSLPRHPTVGLNSIRSAELFGNQRELLIQHAGTYYRLRITSNDKLILTK